MGEDWESWASIIRACMLSSKTPLTIYEINRDTKLLEGRDIPFRQLNFRTLEEMLRKVPGLKVFQHLGKTVVQAIPTEESAHISKMVRAQKTSKKKSRTPPSVLNRFNANYRRPPINRTSPMNANRNSVPQNRYNNNVQNRLNSARNTSHSPRPNSAELQMQVSVQIPASGSSHRWTTADAPTSPAAQTPKNVHFAPKPTQQRISPSSPVQSSVQQRLESNFAQQPQSTTRSPSSIAQRLNMAASKSSATKPSPVDDPRLRLNSYTEARKLPIPVYKDLPTKDHNIYSSVTVDSKKYSSYPKEAKTKDDAEKLAAQAALDELIGKNKKPTVTTSDKILTIKRVLEIVDDHPNGLFQSNLVEYYIAKYNEGLPNNWLKLVENSIIVDVGANNLTILSPQKDEIQKSRLSSPVAILEPEVLKLNDTSFWLHVYVVYNTTDIWGVIIDENHSDKIDELAKDMKAYYDVEQSTPPSVTAGKYYAVFDSEWWHRVRCIKIDPDTEQATIFFIDRGDEDIFPTARLHSLYPKFCQLPAQSVQLSLAGLEAFENCYESQALLEELLVDKDVYVYSSTQNRYAVTLSADLYVVQNDDEINVNELLREKIFNKIIDPTVYLGPEKVAQEVHISYISEKAIFIQLKSKGYKYLKNLMDNLIKTSLSTTKIDAKPVLKFDSSKIFVAKNIADNNWYRVRIIKIENENRAQVMCIDVGNTFTVSRNDLVLLDELSDLLAKFPPQAVRVKLHKISPINFDKKMAAHLRELAPSSEVFYMKVVGNLEDTPVVEFYKRTENNYLASLNDTIALEPEITSKDDNNNAKPRIRNNRSSIDTCAQFPLKAPYIPPIGSFFDVHVTMAAHPGNFTVQSLKTAHELEKLMTALTNVCESYTGPPLTPSCVKVGNIYAAKYDDDGRWYRAYVSKVISKNVCAIYFCDYGDYRAVALEQLQPLQNQFYDLPYQAIKAKLHGITPKLKGDWTVKDSLRFNELTVPKSFVSVVKSCNIDNLTTGETILGLELIDTSTSEDIYITNILINEKRAEKLEELKA